MKGLKGLPYSWSSKRTSVQIQTLPNDLLTEILLQLPVRLLARFQYLSKYWFGVMRTPFFIDNHRLRRGKNGRMLLIRRCLTPPEQDDVLSFHDLDNPELEVQPNFSISFIEGLRTRKWDGSLHVLGACSGIVCIMHEGCVMLCNPALREFKLLPPLPFDCQEGHIEGVIGAGFGISCLGEFKVILVRRYWRTLPLSSQPGPAPFHLYTSGTNSWKQIEDSLVDPWPCFPINELFFNGACHWITTSHEDIFPIVMLYFNIDTEVFGQLELREALTGAIDGTQSPMVFNECLAVVHHDQWYHKSEVVKIWVMGEYGVKESWTFQFIIHPQIFLSPLLIWKNDESLLLEASNGQLASISFLTKVTKRFDIYGVKENMRALVYEESLVRLNQGKTLEEMVSLAKAVVTPLPN